ncbi:MAG: CGGC domain-containing protein [Deltaproteobacteria bacterium]|nr:CGGC domain-containing protein [Deltaproteobacteria bacterium]
MKAGIIRCQQTEDICPGDIDFKFAQTGQGAFAETGPVEIIGFVSCGGCPGKKVLQRAKLLVRKGVDMIVLASCMSRGNPLGFPCPHFQQIRNMLGEKIPQSIKILDWTH